MPVDERRRVALHSQVAAAWGEEAADTLFDLITPAGHELATRQDRDELRRELDRRFDAVDARFDLVDARFDLVDARFEAIDGQFNALADRFDLQDARLDDRFEALEHRLSSTFERRIADAVTTQTRTLVWSQLAALVTIAALAFGLR